MHGTHGEVVQTRLSQEQPLLGQLDARPRYDTSYQTIRRVARDGRLSYRGQLYQVSLRHALSEVCVRESLGGQITIRSLAGIVLPATLVTINGVRLQRHDPAPAVGEHPEQDRLLRLVESPAVERRDLAVYEEVARVAALSR